MEYNKVLKKINEIKTATEKNSNTAEKVGETMQNILEYSNEIQQTVENISAKITDSNPTIKKVYLSGFTSNLNMGLDNTIQSIQIIDVEGNIIQNDDIIYIDSKYMNPKDTNYNYIEWVNPSEIYPKNVIVQPYNFYQVKYIKNNNNIYELNLLPYTLKNKTYNFSKIVNSESITKEDILQALEFTEIKQIIPLYNIKIFYIDNIKNNLLHTYDNLKYLEIIPTTEQCTNYHYYFNKIHFSFSVIEIEDFTLNIDNILIEKL